MATETVLHTYRFKRGKEETINRLNPLLDAGEPIIVFCNDGYTRIKIGNGQLRYHDLNFIGEKDSTSGVFSALSMTQFPTIGEENVIYKDASEQLLYQWNPYAQEYEIVGGAGKSEYISNNRDPEPTDIGYEILSYWINTETDGIFILVSEKNNTANWVHLNKDFERELINLLNHSPKINTMLNNIISRKVDSQFEEINDTLTGLNNTDTVIENNIKEMNDSLNKKIVDLSDEIYQNIKMPTWGKF